MPRVYLSVWVLLAAPLWAQTSNALPGCEAPPEIQKTLHDKLESPAFDKLSFVEQETLRRTVLTDLAARYPREIVPQRRLISAARREEEALHPGSFAVFQAESREQAKEHPDDPLVLDLAAYALNGTDTPESLRLLEAAQAEAPQFVWADLDLAEIYSSGKFADKAKFEEQLAAYWGPCPASTDGYAQRMLKKDLALQARVATTLRSRLAAETDPEKLKGYRFLWSLEFSAHPPQEHAAVRQQVAGDVQRLGGVEAHPDAAWMSLLIDGDKQSGASAGTVHAMEDRLIQKYPQSTEAEAIVSKRWRDAHPEPADAKDTGAWTAYRKGEIEAIRGWLRAYPDDAYLARYQMFYAEFRDNALPEKDGLALVDAYLAAGARQDPPDWLGTRDDAADFLLHHKWQPGRAVDLLEQVQGLQARDEAETAQVDNLSPDRAKDEAEENQYMDRSIRSELVQAAMLAKRPDAVLPLKAAIEGNPPADKKYLSDYWLDRARLAVVEDRREDALTYYQEALRTRLKPPSWEEGNPTDDALDESRALWAEMGGTETAFAVWSKPAAGPAVDAADAEWEKPTKPLPAFQLADLSGKTWTLANLKGKVVLINLWATWCEPCQEELPELEKLYEQAKGRTDIQILTFNLDEDEGLVAPFVKEKGYTFPVLPAYAYTVNLLDGFAIPQNWVINPQGSWQWRQIGFGSGDDHWSKDMIVKLEAAKSGS